MKRAAFLAVALVGFLVPSFTLVENGLIAGHVHYPACVPPADLQVCAVPVEGGEVVCTNHFDSAGGELAYLLEVPAGRWLVYASAPDTMPGVKAFFTEAVRCGLSVRCADHTRVPVVVRPGQLVDDVDPDDWFDQEPNEAEPVGEPSGVPVS